MKNFKLILLLILSISYFQLSAQNAPITTAAKVTATAGTNFSVPITVANFTDIGALSLTLLYDNSILTYQSYTNDSGFPGLILSEAIPGKIITAGFAPYPGISLPPNFVLLTLTFYCIEETSTTLEWFDNGGSCEYADEFYIALNDSPTCSYYINGSVNESSFQIDLKVFLEGAFLDGEMTTELKDLGLVPTSQPYFGLPWNYDGLEAVSSIPENVVDWVLIELRESTGDASTATVDKVIAKQAGFLLKDGTIKNASDCSFHNLEFSVSLSDNLYIVIYHRNHIAAISADPIVIFNGYGNYDFSSGEFTVLEGSLGHKEISSGIWGLAAGDSNGDGKIDELDKIDDWDLNAGTMGYLNADFSMDSQNDNKDKNDFWDLNFGFISRVP